MAYERKLLSYQRVAEGRALSWPSAEPRADPQGCRGARHFDAQPSGAVLIYAKSCHVLMVALASLAIHGRCFNGVTEEEAGC